MNVLTYAAYNRGVRAAREDYARDPFAASREIETGITSALLVGGRITDGEAAARRAEVRQWTSE